VSALDEDPDPLPLPPLPHAASTGAAAAKPAAPIRPFRTVLRDNAGMPPGRFRPTNG
jgi:hypothetical protein